MGVRLRHRADGPPLLVRCTPLPCQPCLVTMRSAPPTLPSAYPTVVLQPPSPIMRGLGGSIHSSCELRHLLRAPLHTYCTAYIQCLCLICPYYKIISIKCTNHLEKRSNLHMSQSNQISEEVVFPETWQIHTCQEPI